MVVQKVDGITPLDSNGTIILTRDNSIWDYTGLLDALLDNGYFVTIARDGECYYIEYRLRDI
jgi:hypothetical protein